MTDRFDVQLRQHLLGTANERPADGQLASVLDAVGGTGQRRAAGWRTWLPERIGPFPAPVVRLGLVALALVAAGLAVMLFAGGPQQSGRTVFEGTWTAMDVRDQSRLVLVVGAGASPPVHFEDGFASGAVCIDDVVKVFTADGVGRISGGRLDVDVPDGGGCGSSVIPIALVYQHNEGTDTLTDQDGIAWTRVPPGEAPPTQRPVGFEGTWTAIDPADGSSLTLTIDAGRSPAVLFVDGFASGEACVEDKVKVFTAAGIGTIEGNRLDVEFPDGGGCESTRVPIATRYDLDAGADKLTDQDGVIWTRVLGDEGPTETQAPPPASATTPPTPDDGSSEASGWIAFTVVDGDDQDVWLAALDEPARRAIGSADDQVDELCPAFSPDGRHIAYGRVEAGIASLAIADVRRNGLVTDPELVEVGDGLPAPCPVWSADGERIAFGVNRTSPVNPDIPAAGSEVWIVNAADGTTAALPDLLATDLEWSPDGRLLAIASGTDALVQGNVLHDGRIHLVEAADGTVRTLESTLGATNLTWAPDGTRIAYASIAGSGDSEHQLRVVDITTGTDVVLDPRYGALHGAGPAWSPAGDAIAYQRSCEACGSEETEVVLIPTDDLSEAAPKVVIQAALEEADGGDGLIPFWVAWSPDGRYLLFKAWKNPVSDGPGNDTGSVLAAVPVGEDLPVVLLADAQQLVVYDGYDESTFVPIQVWGSRPPN